MVRGQTKMAAGDMFTFFADVKQELGVLLVVLGIPKYRSCSLLSVSVNENALEVTFNRGEDVQRLCKFHVTGISILPASCNRLQISADGVLHLRFQLKIETASALHSPGLQHNDASKNPNSWTNQVSDVISVLRGESYEMLCRMCASPIVQNKKFHRVLPCPSDDWFEMSESWWCHRHDHGHDHSHDHDHSDQDHSGLLRESSLLSHNSVLETKTNSNYSQDRKVVSIIDDQNSSLHDQTAVSITNDRRDAQTDLDQMKTTITVDLPDAENKDLTCNQILSCDHYLNSSYENQPCLSGPRLDQKRDTDHDNNCEQISLDQNRLLMGVADCLVSDINIVLDESSLLPRSCLTTDKARVQCARCRCFLGRFRNSDSVKQASSFLDSGQNCLQLMLHMLVVTSDPSKIDWPYSSEKLEVELASYLQTERETANSFRFIIETRNEKNAVVPVIALWIVDVRTLLYRASSSLSVSAEQECIVSPLPVIKLMYKDCLREQNKRTGHMWYRDLTVQSIELPEPTCLSILKLLIDSTKSLPQSLRLVGDFYVGFLRR